MVGRRKRVGEEIEDEEEQIERRRMMTEREGERDAEKRGKEDESGCPPNLVPWLLDIFPV